MSEAKRLAPGAEVTAPLLYRDPLDGAATDGARFSSSVSNLEITMSCAQLALRTDVGVHARPFAIDGCPENFADAMT